MNEMIKGGKPISFEQSGRTEANDQSQCATLRFPWRRSARISIHQLALIQFEMGIPGGAEAAVHATSRYFKIAC